MKEGEEDNQRLGATTLYFTPPERATVPDPVRPGNIPDISSLRNRPELDSLLVNVSGQTVNVTQKPVELYRWIHRHFSDGDKLRVLSLCDGTGSAVIAAAADGHDAVGIDYNRKMHVAARNRMTTFDQLESLRLQLYQPDESVQVKASKKFAAEVSRTGPMWTADLSWREVALKWDTMVETAPEAEQEIARSVVPRGGGGTPTKAIRTLEKEG